MANTKIPSELIADSSITAAKLADGTITTDDLAGGIIITSKIANCALTTAKIGDAQVTTAKITDANVTTGKIADDAVTTAKMASNSVTSDTIASNITLAGTTTLGGTLDGNGNKVLFANVYSSEGDLPSASTYHGMFAHVHGTGKGYFAHAGNWVPLANQSDLTVTTTTANAALPKAGGTMTGPITMSQSGALHNQFTSTGSSSKISIISADGEQAYINYSGATNEMSAGYDRTTSQFRICNADTLSSGIRMSINSSTGNTSIAGATQDRRLTINNSQANGLQFNFDDSNAYRIRLTPYWSSNANTRLDFDVARSSGATPSTIMSVGYDSNVGIGTSTPDQKLSVIGTIQSTVGLRVAGHPVVGYASITGGYAAQLGSTGTSTLNETHIYSGGTLRAVFDGSGNFGIGGSPTNSSGYKTLDIKGSTGGQLLLGRSSQFDFFAFTSANSTSIGTAVGQDLIIRTNSNGGNNERMRIKSGGNVGIGTDSPDAPLSIYNASLTTVGSGLGGIRVHRPGAFGQFGYMEYGHGTGATYIGSSYTGGNAASYGVIQFRQHSNGGTPLDSMIIDSEGQVGIGTGTPSNLLSIRGSGQEWDESPAIKLWDSHNSKGWYVGSANNHTPGDFYIRSVTSEAAYPVSGDQEFTIKQNGNVGIGTISPAYPLEVKHNSNTLGIKITGGTGAANSSLVISNGASSGVAWDISSTGGGHGYGNGDLNFSQGFAVPKVQFKNNGNVGIGNFGSGTAPQSLLHIQGTNNSAGDLYTAVGVGNCPGISIGNTGTTDNNNAALYFRNDGGERASIGARFVSHSNEKTELRFSTTNGSGATRERVRINGDGVIIATSTVSGSAAVNHFEISKTFSATGSAVTKHEINLINEIGATTAGNLHYQVSVGGYGSGGSNGLNATYSVAGYSGHNWAGSNHGSMGAGTINNGYKSSDSTSPDAKGLVYHPCINMGSYIQDGEVYAYSPGGQRYGFTISNNSSTAIAICITVRGWYR